MKLLEQTIPNSDVREIVDKIKSYYDSGNYTFDDTVNGINFWGADDLEKTVFFQTEEGGYATITKDYLNDIDSCVESIEYQLNGTEAQ